MYSKTLSCFVVLFVLNAFTNNACTFAQQSNAFTLNARSLLKQNNGEPNQVGSNHKLAIDINNKDCSAESVSHVAQASYQENRSSFASNSLQVQQSHSANEPKPLCGFFSLNVDDGPPVKQIAVEGGSEFLFIEKRASWHQPEPIYGRLYFEQPTLERGGIERNFQFFRSSIRFYSTSIALPALKLSEHSYRCARWAE